MAKTVRGGVETESYAVETGESDIAETVSETAGSISADPEKEDEKEYTLSLRSVSLMYGEDGSNNDGNLDRLFAPSLFVDGEESAQEVNAEYAFYEELPSDDDADGVSMIEFSKTASELSKIPAGTLVRAVATYATDDGKEAEGSSDFTVLKREVTYTENGESVSAEAVADYSVNDKNETVTVTGKYAGKAVDPDAEDFADNFVCSDGTDELLKAGDEAAEDVTEESNDETGESDELLSEEDGGAKEAEEPVEDELMGTPSNKSSWEENYFSFGLYTGQTLAICAGDDYLGKKALLYVADNPELEGAVAISGISITDKTTASDFWDNNNFFLPTLIGDTEGDKYLFVRVAGLHDDKQPCLGKSCHVKILEALTVDAVKAVSAPDAKDGEIQISGLLGGRIYFMHKTDGVVDDVISKDTTGGTESINNASAGTYLISAWDPTTGYREFYNNPLYGTTYAYAEVGVKEAEEEPAKFSIIFGASEAPEIESKDLGLSPASALGINGWFKSKFVSVGRELKFTGKVFDSSSKPLKNQKINMYPEGAASEALVDIDNDLGIITCKKAGDATILAVTDAKGGGAKQGYLKLSISEPPQIKSIKVTPDKVTKLGMRQYSSEISVKIDPGLSGTIDWSVADPNVCQIMVMGDPEDKYRNAPVYDGESDPVILMGVMGGYTELTGTLYNIKDDDENLYAPRTISIPVCVDGASDASGNFSYYVDGKPLTGFVAFDHAMRLVATGAAALSRIYSYVMYFDENGISVTDDFVRFGNKLYYIDDSGALLRGTSNKDTTTVPDHMINMRGEVLTGWQKWRDKDNVPHEKYFDPDANGELVAGRFVKKGNSYVYVIEHTNPKYNGDICTDSVGKEIPAGSGNWYALKAGVVQAGMCYFQKGPYYLTTKADKTDGNFMSYADPVTGKLQAGFFTDGKNKYYAVQDEDTTSTPPKYDIPKIQTGVFSDGTDQYYADENGVIKANATVKDGDKVYRTDSNGMLIKPKTKIALLGGKACLIGMDGDMIDANGEPYDSGYVTEDGTTHVYVKATKGRPENGVKFFIDSACRVPMKDHWITDGTSDLFYVNKSGNIATGIVKVAVDGKEAIIHRAAYTYYFKEDGKPYKAANANTFTINKKVYNIDENGEVFIPTHTGSVYDHVWFNDGYTDYLVASNKATGELFTGITTLGGYKIVFGDDGKVKDPTEPITEYKGKLYLKANPTSKSGPQAFYIIRGSGKVLHDDKYYFINSDGSIKPGWNTDTDKKKYYQDPNDLYEGVAKLSFAKDKILYRIGGKLYAFNEDNSMATGLLAVNLGSGESLGVYDTDAQRYTKYKPDDAHRSMCFWFDEKSGAAISGTKKAKAPMVNSMIGQISCADDGSVFLSTATKTLYFHQQDMGYAPAGALAVNSTCLVGKNMQTFGADGALLEYAEDGVHGDRYYKKNGVASTGRVEVKDKGGNKEYYYFNSVDGKMEKNVLRKSGGKWYWFGNDGRMSRGLAIEYGVTVKHTGYALFAKDGSITGFTDSSGYGSKLANVQIKVAGASDAGGYVLDGKGLPLTGTVYNPGDPALLDIPVAFYQNADGSNPEVIFTATKDALVKSGNKYYAVANDDAGFCVIDKPATGNYIKDIGDWSLLPDKDRQAFDEYMINCGEPKVIISSDGSLLCNKTVYIMADDEELHTNAYGMILEKGSPFQKIGGKWHFYISNNYANGVTSAFGAGMTKKSGAGTVSALLYNATTGSFETINGRYNSNFELQIDKSVNGVYCVGSSKDSHDNTIIFYIYIKNGVITTGKQKVTLNLGGGYVVTGTVNFDPDYGFGNLIIR